jgi:hypothetical protein
MKVVALKITALFSYCGGPLFISDLLKPHLHPLPAFLITFLPIGFMVIGALCLEDDPRSRWASAAVWAGRQGVYLALGMHLYALGCFLSGTRVSEPYLYYLGIVVGVVWGAAYLRAAGRREVRSSDAGHRSTTRRIGRS